MFTEVQLEEFQRLVHHARREGEDRESDWALCYAEAVPDLLAEVKRLQRAVALWQETARQAYCNTGYWRYRALAAEELLSTEDREWAYQEASARYDLWQRGKDDS